MAGRLREHLSGPADLHQSRHRRSVRESELALCLGTHVPEGLSADRILRLRALDDADCHARRPAAVDGGRAVRQRPLLRRHSAAFDRGRSSHGSGQSGIARPQRKRGPALFRRRQSDGSDGQHDFAGDHDRRSSNRTDARSAAQFPPRGDHDHPLRSDFLFRGRGRRLHDPMGLEFRLQLSAAARRHRCRRYQLGDAGLGRTQHSGSDDRRPDDQSGRLHRLPANQRSRCPSRPRRQRPWNEPGQ